MAEDRQQRIQSALGSLIVALVPGFEGESDYEVEERQLSARELAKSILASPRASALEASVNHAGDLIKRKLLNSTPDGSPEIALRFANLYSRLLTQPVLSQKWAILYLLYQLSDSDDMGDSPPFNNSAGVSRNGRGLSESRPPDTLRPEEAFAPEGLRKLPSREGQREITGATQREEVASGAVLAENYTDLNPTELELLRYLPFMLQGISSTLFTFTTTPSVKLPPTLPSPVISVLYTLAEPGLLYKTLESFVQSAEGGLLEQSLRAAIKGELRSYLGVIASLEGQIRRAEISSDENLSTGNAGKSAAAVTLRKCVIWTRDATMGLRLLSWIAAESKSKRGGQLISLIHGLSLSHGDPLISAHVERLLTHVTRPFYDMLRHWIYDGELSDPYHEFFVFEQDPNEIQTADDGKSRRDVSSVWEGKYKVEENMIPSIITQDFAKKVFLIGKSLNFMRYSCGDSLWVQDYSKAATKELKYGDTATLEAWIDEAHKTTMTRLIQLMADKFHLFEHLKAFKNYILLGQGDFIALLMESLSTDLDRPAGRQFRHNLTSKLEIAVRGSNAQYDSPEVLRRLDARMLQQGHGDIGWDCFTLEYKVDAPCDVVVTEWGNRQYLKVFNLLWKLKRVEFVLSTTWRKCMTGARGVLHNVDENLAPTWKSTRGVVAEMIHFIGQLQYYILFEVIEKSWAELQTAIIKEGCTLDDLIEAHTKYLNNITHKGLLGAKKGRHGEKISATDNNPYMEQLSHILRSMLSYRDVVDGLYSFSVAEFTRQQEVSVRAETGQGRYDVHDSDDDVNQIPTPATTRRGPKRLALESLSSTPIPGTIPGLRNGAEEDVLPALQERLKGLGADFKIRLSMLLGDLAYQPDEDLRFLGMGMNFNDFYQGTRKSRGKERPRDQDKAVKVVVND